MNQLQRMLIKRNWFSRYDISIIWFVCHGFELKWRKGGRKEAKLGRISVWMRKWDRNEYKYRTKYRNHVVLYGTEIYFQVWILSYHDQWVTLGQFNFTFFYIQYNV